MIYLWITIHMTERIIERIIKKYILQFLECFSFYNLILSHERPSIIFLYRIWEVAGEGGAGGRRTLS